MMLTQRSRHADVDPFLNCQSQEPVQPIPFVRSSGDRGGRWGERSRKWQRGLWGKGTCSVVWSFSESVWIAELVKL